MGNNFRTPLRFFQKKKSKRRIFVKFGSDHSGKTKVVKVLSGIIFLVLLCRIFYMQIIDYQKYKAMSEKNSIKIKRIETERGKIYDKNGVLLATNSTGYRIIYINGRDENEDDIKRIVDLTGYSYEFIKKRIKVGELTPYTKENLIIDDIDEVLAHKIMEKLTSNDPMFVQVYSKRKYIYDSFASHVIGYVKKISATEYKNLKDEGYSLRDAIGKNGIEKQYDDTLKGKVGLERIEVNAYNKLQRKLDKQDEEPGSNLYLTIDFRLQDFMEETMKKNKLSGAFIAMNPKTGAIITQVSYPTFSLNSFSTRISKDEWEKIINDPARPLNNKAIAGEYPPGSIFKPIPAFAFLTKGIDPYEKIFDPGYYSIGTQKWKTWKVGGHGWTDMIKSLVESVNTYYYKYSDLYGYKQIVEYGKLFQLGEYTGIDLPGERKGIMPSPEWKQEKLKQTWKRGDTINLSIGQGYLLVTPIQMAQVYQMFANRGILYQPRLVDAIETNGVKVEIKPKEVKRIDLPQNYYDILDEALRQTVENNDGTAKSMRTPGLSIGAKSGSAENNAKNTTLTHAWIAGYFPLENPEVVFVAIFEQAGGGGAVAGGTTKLFIDKYLALKKYDADKKAGKIVEEIKPVKEEIRQTKEQDIENAISDDSEIITNEHSTTSDVQNNVVAVPSKE